MDINTDLRKIALIPSGQVGKTWIYWKSKNKKYRRPYVIPFDPKTLPQIETRNKMIIIGQWYNALTPQEKQYYDAKSKTVGKPMTGYNYFFKIKFKEVTVMVIEVIHGKQLVVDGINYIAIPEIVLAKSALHYNSGYAGVAGVVPRQEGIRSAWFSSSTEITVDCADSAGTDTVNFAYEIVKYV